MARQYRPLVRARRSPASAKKPFTSQTQGRDLRLAVKKFVHAVARTYDGDVHRAVLETVERVVLKTALARSKGNALAASRALGISRGSMYGKAALFGLKHMRRSREIA